MPKRWIFARWLDAYLGRCYPKAYSKLTLFISLHYENRRVKLVYCVQRIKIVEPEFSKYLLRVIVCDLFGTKPLPELMLSYCQLDP